MKYFKISNKGELDIRLISLMGGTTKAENPNKIGQFGTGLKYAIAYLIRNKNNFRLFIGTDEVEFETREEKISGKMFSEIYCNGKSMNITTHYGYQWKCWEAIREIWCNAKDEGGEQKKETSENSIISGVDGRTTMYVEITEEVELVLSMWDEYFLTQKPIFENDKYSIYLNTGEKLKLYKNRVLVHSNDNSNSLFVYDSKEADLNELRQYMGYATIDATKAILQSNKSVIDIYIDAFLNKKDCFETKLDYTYFNYSKDHIKDIFSGYMFLHPDSDRKGKNKSIPVTKSLFKILQDCELPSEKIFASRGASYGGYGYGYDDDVDVEFLSVSNTVLESRIKLISEKYDVQDFQFQIVQPIGKSKFEISFDDYEPMFNEDLHRKSDADLEAAVLVAIFHEQDGNVYEALKRLMKYSLADKNFINILFGKKQIKENEAIF